MFSDTQFTKKLIAVKTWLSTPPPEAPREDQAVWYGGPVVDAHTFTTQLCNLQSSLQAAGTVELETVKVRSQS